MKYNWNDEKNIQLKQERDVSFEEIVYLIDDGHLVTILKHPKRKNQIILVVEKDEYCFNIPCIFENDSSIFLKTIYPSRKSTRDLKVRRK